MNRLSLLLACASACGSLATLAQAQTTLTLLNLPIPTDATFDARFGLSYTNADETGVDAPVGGKAALIEGTTAQPFTDLYNVGGSKALDALGLKVGDYLIFTADVLLPTANGGLTGPATSVIVPQFRFYADSDMNGQLLFPLDFDAGGDFDKRIDTTSALSGAAVTVSLNPTTNTNTTSFKTIRVEVPIPAKDQLGKDIKLMEWAMTVPSAIGNTPRVFVKNVKITAETRPLNTVAKELLKLDIPTNARLEARSGLAYLSLEEGVVPPGTDMTPAAQIGGTTTSQFTDLYYLPGNGAYDLSSGAIPAGSVIEVTADVLLTTPDGGLTNATNRIIRPQLRFYADRDGSGGVGGPGVGGGFDGVSDFGYRWDTLDNNLGGTATVASIDLATNTVVNQFQRISVRAVVPKLDKNPDPQAIKLMHWSISLPSAVGNAPSLYIKNFLVKALVPPPPGPPNFPASKKYTQTFSDALGPEWALGGMSRQTPFNDKGVASITGTGGGSGQIAGDVPAGVAFPLPPIQPRKSYEGAGTAPNTFSGQWLMNAGANTTRDGITLLKFINLPPHDKISLGFLFGRGASIDPLDVNVLSSNQYFTVRVNKGAAGEMEPVVGANGESRPKDANAQDVGEVIFTGGNVHPYYREAWTSGAATVDDRAPLTWTVGAAYDLLTTPLVIDHTANTLEIEFLHGLDQAPTDEFVAVDNVTVELIGSGTGVTIATWAAGFYTPQEVTALQDNGWLADTDRDGLNTLMEFALGTDPTMATPVAARPTSAVVQQGVARFMALSYMRPSGAASRAGLTAGLEASDGLASGWAAVVGADQSVVDNANGTETVTLRDSNPLPPILGAAERRFFRIRFTLN